MYWPEELKNYNDIKEKFSNANILLGNGFSINFSDTFRYKKLYDFFIKSCSDASKKLFKELDTDNFENVLESIETTELVCKALNINYNKFEEHKIEIKKGLIDSIGNIHPKITDPNWLEIKNKLNLVSSQFNEFENIFTTNYDILLYYIILALEDENPIFGDYFAHSDGEYTYFDESNLSRERHIYYLHGALFLFEQNFDTCKIKAKNSLLNDISKEIENNNYPIFVSEGTSNSKLKAIKSNDYLTFCLKQFKKKINSDGRLVIFGQSLSDQDQHLVDIIDENCKKIAISINSDHCPTIGALKQKKSEFQAKFKRVEEIFFYDSKTLFNFWTLPFF